jgi:hypothetical protein
MNPLMPGRRPRLGQFESFASHLTARANERIQERRPEASGTNPPVATGARSIHSADGEFGHGVPCSY